MTAPTPEQPPHLSPGAARLSAALHARAERATLPRATVMEAFTTALPGAARSDNSRTALATLLEELSDAGVLRLPHGQAGKWDAGRPALPEHIRLPAVTPPKAAPAATRRSYRPELDWAHTARLTTAHHEVVALINRWFRDTSNRLELRAPISLRERSYEIFQDEKRLDALIYGALFAPGRLTLEQLGTYREPPPLAFRQLGDGDTLLVAENSDTYATLRDLLAPNPGRTRAVAFGSGRAFEASIETAKEIRGIQRILYYGDLDAEGLSIPARASVTATQIGLPPVEPATALYDLLLSHTPTPGQPLSEERAHTLAAWLAPTQRQETHDVLMSGRRIAQEATNRNQLAGDATWLP
ncbi:Wadjet anti-phage system protein JetD domain-containing protein [Streptomyces sp. NPDC047042]|uniref:Wadjet anti-phage system protein JetD domain-containing protein n=1 Tax=Streptomyces sp. NPDC047042 TaxID=3154807 RepID=UPI003404D9FD